MAKTVFSNGTVLSAAAANGWQGHVHDGADADGSAPQVNPVAHVSGVTEGEFDMVFPASQFSAQQTVTVRYRKEVSPTASKPAMVTLMLPNFSAAGTASTEMSPNATPLPAAIRPKTDTFAPMAVINNATEHHGAMRLNADGSIVFEIAYGGGVHQFSATSFGTSVTKGFYASILMYPVYP